MKLSRYAASVLLVISSSVYANCNPHVILDIAQGNAAIAITGGTVWQVFPHDRNAVYSWKTGDEVMMCYGHMVNKQQDDEQVSVRYLGHYDEFFHGVPYPYKGWCCGGLFS